MKLKAILSSGNVFVHVFLLTFAVLVIGCIGGLVVTSLLVVSHEIMSPYTSMYMVTLLILIALSKYVRVSREFVSITRDISLVNFFIFLITVAHVLFFNLVNTLYPHNPLVISTAYIRELTNEEILWISYTVISIIILINSFIALTHLFPHRIKDIPKYSLVSMRIRRAIKALLILIFVFSLVLYPTVNLRYSEMVSSEIQLVKIQCETSADPVECIWNFVENYVSNFTPTYMKPFPKPRQLIISISSSLSNRDFVARLASVARTGACFDYALGITKLIEDLYGFRTRVVIFIGQDHAIPEVEINGSWYIIDAVYTTKSHPVKADDYADYLRKNYPNVYGNLTGLIDFDTGQDLSYEHGICLHNSSCRDCHTYLRIECG